MSNENHLFALLLVSSKIKVDTECTTDLDKFGLEFQFSFSSILF